MRWDRPKLTQVVDVARGVQPADLCIRNCRIVNVLTGRVETRDLTIFQDLIVGWGDYRAKATWDAEGLYVCPGFVDGHIHLESSLLNPFHFSNAVAPWGTSAVIADPHEIANVLGLEGIRYVLRSSENQLVDIFFNLPSCVPASPLETSGAQLRATDLYSLIPHERILGLAEMMNFPGVLHHAEDVTDKLLLFQDRILDGHAPLLKDRELNGYLAAGIGSDHECTTREEAEEKLSKGMTIMIREGSQSKDLEALLPIVNDHTWPRCMFVSDDRHPDDLMENGHMNAIVNKAVRLGMDPVRALTLATWTPCRYFRLPRRGAIAPGYAADFSMSPSLHPWEPVHVFKRGMEVARRGKLLKKRTAEMAARAPGSPMRIGPLDLSLLKVPLQPGLLRTIGVREGTLLTEELLFTPTIDNGFVTADPARDILKLAVFNRYIPDRPPAVGFVTGIGLAEGAAATTIAHDSHNLIAVGASDEAILRTVDALRDTGGGMAIGNQNGPIAVLPLPIAGLMSSDPIERVVERLLLLKKLATAMGSPLKNVFMALSFLALPVIPQLKMTDLGLVDVSTFSIVPLFKSI
ncbi:MAG: adenine deaminase [Deltaproteobacteria bacterium]|nr:adenine deaminase [Deltaproteobacteria bacterium]